MDKLKPEIMEHLAKAVHQAYCRYYLKSKGKAYWTKGKYKLLDEATKQIDRETVKAVIAAWNTCPSPWVRVEDGLPKKNGRYLIFDDSGLAKVWIFTVKQGWRHDEYEITHWQEIELPEDKT